MQKTREEKLECRYGKTKSFYGKALVKWYEDENGIESSCVLQSYNTDVAEINKDGVLVLHPQHDCSDTTSRHVDEFLIQMGFGEHTGVKARRAYEKKQNEVKKPKSKLLDD